MLMQSQYLGLFNTTSNGNSSNRIFAVEYNTKQSIDIEDIDEMHEGIDVNGLKSIPATYFSIEERNNISLELINLHPIQVWVDYNGEKLLTVTLAPTTSFP
ncbi:hypothetical protein J1N35_012771 [Gossypium stocksii]|uniref:Legume lectin domain-containing protein n=1 Tax=Gossypium stocksii TaxID=47602 RepID=A0A9D4AEQ3_9ROSI|nr:hypothetical protein J1N35_012771 [Gossypium stocksii]